MPNPAPSIGASAGGWEAVELAGRPRGKPGADRYSYLRVRPGISGRRPNFQGTGPARIPWTTLGYVEKVRPQFLSLRHLTRGHAFSARTPRQLGPVMVAISYSSFALSIGKAGLFFSEGPIYLRSSGLVGFGTLLEIERFELPMTLCE